jgi:hypothetical protein
MGWTLIAMVLTMTRHLRPTSYPWNHPQILVHIDAYYTFEFIDDIDCYVDVTTSCATRILALARSQLHHCCVAK